MYIHTFENHSSGRSICHSPVKVVKDGDQKVLIELKGIRELGCHLPHTVHKLEEDGCSLIITVVTITMAQPLLINETLMCKCK